MRNFVDDGIRLVDVDRAGCPELKHALFPSKSEDLLNV